MTTKRFESADTVSENLSQMKTVCLMVLSDDETEEINEEALMVSIEISFRNTVPLDEEDDFFFNQWRCSDGGSSL